MNVSKISEAKAFEVKPGRTRRILHTDHLMMVAFDFADGPAAQPDRPHIHPHEQVTYVAEGEVMFFIGEESTRLASGNTFDGILREDLVDVLVIPSEDSK